MNLLPDLDITQPSASINKSQSQRINLLPDLAITNEEISPFMSGVTGFNTGVERLTHGIMQPLLESGLLGEAIKQGSQRMGVRREKEYSETAKQHPYSSLAGNLIGSIGASIPAMAIPGIGQSNLIRNLTQGAAQAATLGGAEYVSPGQSRVENAAIAAPFGLAGGAIKSGLEAIRPSSLFRGTLSNKQLSENLSAAQGTETPLGDVIQSPWLKRRLENTLANLIGSGATNKLQENAQNIKGQGEQLLKNLLRKNPLDKTSELPFQEAEAYYHPSENVPQQIHEALKKEMSLAELQKSNAYKSANSIASESKYFKLYLPKFSEHAKEFAHVLEESNMLKYEPQEASLLKKLVNYKEPMKEIISQESSIPGKGELSRNKLLRQQEVTSEVSPTLEEAGIMKGKLNSYANKLSTSPNPTDRGQSKVFRKLANSLKQDILDSIENSGDQKLKQSYLNAEENYKKNYSPFLDKEVFKYANKWNSADSDLITQAFIKSGQKTDRGNLVKKIVDKLPEDKKNLPAYDLFSKAIDKEGNLSPIKFKTIFDKLGNRQIKALIPDQSIRNELNKYSKLVGLNKESFQTMFNPKTGQRNLDALHTLIYHGLGGALGNLGGRESDAGTLGTTGLTLAGLIAPGLAARPIVNKLTSEPYRQALINAMVKNKGLPLGGSGALAEAIKQTGDRQ